MGVPVSKGFLIYAENLEGVNYVEQAYALALSIKASQKSVTSVSLVTNDDSIPDKYRSVFDNVISIPWYNTPGTEFSGEHRWKMYHVTPYNETIVLDADMLFVEDISDWWSYCSNFDIKFCSKIKNYKQEPIIDTYHRTTFIANQLTSPYCALHYFRKTDAAYEFYKVLEFVCNNWEWCWNKFAPELYQDWLSMDLAVAVAIEIIGNHDTIIDSASPLEFVHMKPAIQGWDPIPAKWQSTVPFVLNTKGELIVGNIKQTKLFHYVEKDFITPKIISRLEGLANV